MLDAPGNQPPVACAGADQVITVPASTVNLNGSCSSDPDNNITSYNWTKISGPLTLSIANANAVQTQVTSLVQGVYQFELKVTDAGGLFSKDTVQITVNNDPTFVVACDNTNRPIVNAQLTQVGTLSQTRSWTAIASAGNKIFIAGGFIPPGTHSSRVDVYDLTTQTWSTADLSVARSGAAAITAGNKVFFAGGEISDGTCASKAVDIYDVATGQWSTASLSIAGSGVAPAVVSNKVLFAGGDAGFCGSWARSTTVDIYHLSTNSWSVTSLSTVRRSLHTAVTLGNKVYISGGESWPPNPVPGTWFASNTIDIYDNVSNSWSTGTLTQGKYDHAGIAVNDKILWAGGQTGSYPNITSSCTVEIHNMNTGNVSIQSLSKPGRRTAVLKNNLIIFNDGTRNFDIYDTNTNTWSIGVLPIMNGGGMISVNNALYLVTDEKLYKLEF
jgi:N-acetylneuraminic acid mutarotase